METTILSKISIGLDLATAISIIGAVIAFIHNNIKVAKKTIGEERERERVINLSSKRDKLSKLIVKFFVFKEDEEKMLVVLHEIHEFVKYELWPSFVLYSRPGDIKAVVDLLDKFEAVSQEINKNHTFNMRGFAEDLIKLETVIMVQLRQLLSVESETETNRIVGEYVKKNYY